MMWPPERGGTMREVLAEPNRNIRREPRFVRQDCTQTAHGIEHTTETVLLLAGEGTSYALRGWCVITKVKD